MRRYELSEYEWRVIAPLLPNKPRGVAAIETGAFEELTAEYRRIMLPSNVVRSRIPFGVQA